MKSIERYPQLTQLVTSLTAAFDYVRVQRRHWCGRRLIRGWFLSLALDPANLLLDPIHLRADNELLCWQHRRSLFLRFQRGPRFVGCAQLTLGWSG